MAGVGEGPIGFSGDWLRECSLGLVASKAFKRRLIPLEVSSDALGLGFWKGPDPD